MKKLSLLLLVLCFCGFSQINSTWTDNKNHCPPDLSFDPNAPVKDYEQKRQEAYIIDNRTHVINSDYYAAEVNNINDIGLDLAVINFKNNINNCLADTTGGRITIHNFDDERHMFKISDNSIIYASINKCKTLDTLRILDASDNWNNFFCVLEAISPIVGSTNIYDLVYDLETKGEYNGKKVFAYMEEKLQFGMPVIVVGRNRHDPAFDIIGKNCDLNYARACVPISTDKDLNCSDIPFSNFRVIGVDHHNLDDDNNGIACEPFIP